MIHKWMLALIGSMAMPASPLQALAHSGIPLTGDDSNVYMWVSLMLLVVDVFLAAVLVALCKKPEPPASKPARGRRR